MEIELPHPGQLECEGMDSGEEMERNEFSFDHGDVGVVCMLSTSARTPLNLIGFARL